MIQELSNRIHFFVPQLLILSTLIFLAVFLWRKYEMHIGVEPNHKKLFLPIQLSIYILILLSSISIFYKFNYNLPLFVSSILFFVFVLPSLILSSYVFLHYVISLSEKLSALLSLTLSILLFIFTLICISAFPFAADFHRYFYILLFCLFNFFGLTFSAVIFYIVVLRKKYICEATNNIMKKYLFTKRIIYIITLSILVILSVIVLLVSSMSLLYLIVSENNNDAIIESFINYMGFYFPGFVMKCFPLLIFLIFIFIAPMLFILRTNFFEKFLVLTFVMLAFFTQPTIMYALSIRLPFEYGLILACFSMLISATIFFEKNNRYYSDN